MTFWLRSRLWTLKKNKRIHNKKEADGNPASLFSLYEYYQIIRVITSIYIPMPRRSLVIWTNGPVAMAGSM